MCSVSVLGSLEGHKGVQCVRVSAGESRGTQRCAVSQSQCWRVRQTPKITDIDKYISETHENVAY